MRYILAFCGYGAMAACTPMIDDPAAAYTPPEASGLVSVRPYPTPDDVCQVIGENELTNQFLDHTAILIGCPTHETGAIAQRISEGATTLPIIGAWQLLSIPQ